jgi:signal transduction histidine kinase
LSKTLFAAYGLERAMQQRTEERMKTGGAERTQVEAVVESLATMGCRGESVAEVAHDARNMVAALGLYCDLLEEPGVLAVRFKHYGNELRLVAAASRRLVDKLVTLDGGRDADARASLNKTLSTLPELSPKSSPESKIDASLEPSIGVRLDTGTSSGTGGRKVIRTIQAAATGEANSGAGTAGSGSLPGRGWLEGRRHETTGRWDLMPAAPIENMAAELLANHNLLAALAGPTITVTVDVERGARPVRLTGEDLTRVMVNLVKNAAEAMPAGGRIQIGLCELSAAAGAVEALSLTVEDSGPGIPVEALEKIFTSGYTTRAKGTEARGSWPVIHRGLGLAITRSIVEAAGGRIAAGNRALSGASFAIELPVRIH